MKALMQACTGIDAMIVAGEVVMLNGQHTGALPGRLLRGGRDHTGLRGKIGGTSIDGVSSKCPTR